MSADTHQVLTVKIRQTRAEDIAAPFQPLAEDLNLQGLIAQLFLIRPRIVRLMDNVITEEHRYQELLNIVDGFIQDVNRNDAHRAQIAARVAARVAQEAEAYRPR